LIVFGIDPGQKEKILVEVDHLNYFHQDFFFLCMDTFATAVGINKTEKNMGAASPNPMNHRIQKKGDKQKQDTILKRNRSDPLLLSPPSSSSAILYILFRW
jgi:hypothetical protein